MKDKNLLITLSITIILFSFISFLIYTIYCYSFYNPYQEKKLANLYNNQEYDYIYNNLDNNILTFKEFMIPLNLMYDKTNLNDIYNKYYLKSNISQESFINEYYYNNNNIIPDDIEFIYEGKTNLIHRRKIKYSKIYVKNKKENTSTIGLLKNINLLIEEHGEIKIDNNYLTCTENKCNIEYIYGGLHEIIYTSNNNTYFGLLNITKDNDNIEISLINNLIKIS